MSTLQTARRYEELLSAPAEPSPYDYATLFQAEGWFARRRAQARFKLLRAIDPDLRDMLHAGERVYFVTSGAITSMAEQFFAGRLAYYLNLRALIFTTERVLLLQIDRSNRPRDLVAQLSYAAIAELNSTWDRCCRLRLRDHATLNFAGVPAADRRFLRTLLGDLVHDSAGSLAGSRAVGLENLCPHCLAVVAGFPASCPRCGGGFKLARRAGWLSALFPGLGHLYLRHYSTGLLEVLTAVTAWMGMVLGPLLGPGGGATADYWMRTAATLAVCHGLDALITYHFAAKGLYPAAAPVPVRPASG